LQLEEVATHFPKFIGKITQRPPAFSAIQVNGQRLYDLARRGEISTVEIPMRSVDIKEIQPLAWTNGDYPELDVAIACGSGTYIRAIARDLGEIIGCGATLSELRRTYSNGFGLDASLTFEQIADLLRSNSLEVLATDHGLHFLPIISLDKDDTKRWCMGQTIASDIFNDIFDASQLISVPQHEVKFARTYSSERQFLGVSEICKMGIQPIVVLHPIN
jgi:tRNA pseudouridine55 synthase